MRLRVLGAPGGGFADDSGCLCSLQVLGFADLAFSVGSSQIFTRTGTTHPGATDPGPAGDRGREQALRLL